MVNFQCIKLFPKIKIKTNFKMAQNLKETVYFDTKISILESDADLVTINLTPESNTRPTHHHKICIINKNIDSMARSLKELESRIMPKTWSK